MHYLTTSSETDLLENFLLLFLFALALDDSGGGSSTAIREKSQRPVFPHVACGVVSITQPKFHSREVDTEW